MKRIFVLMQILCLLCLFSLGTNAALDYSEGREYKLITPSSQAFPDNGSKLTDGVYGTLPDGADAYYSSPAYVGFSLDDADDHGNFVIIMDLGEVRENITEITVGYLNERLYGIYAPKSISFAIAETRNSNYEFIGTVNLNPEIDGETGGPLAKSFAANNATGQFLKVTITPDEFENPKTQSRQRAKWTFIDEINVRSEPSQVNNQNQLNENSDIKGDTPQTGDNSMRPLAFVLLGVSAATMFFSLFVKGRTKKY